MAQIREANLPRELDAVERLWLEYLTWGNDGLESRYGFRLPVRGAVDRDLENVAKFQPPDGRLLLAFDEDPAIGTACMRRIGPDTVEIKRMYVEPSHRGAGVGRGLLGELIAAAGRAVRPSSTRQPGFHDRRACIARPGSSTSTRTQKARSPTSTRPTGSSWSEF